MLKKFKLIKRFGINLRSRNFSIVKDEEKNTINVEESPEEIDISNAKEAEFERVIKLKDIYEIKSKKMPPRDIDNLIDRSKFENKNVKMRSVFLKEDKIGREVDRNYIPVSPRLGPFEILEPKLEDKTYHWCACGMSSKQPFCDGSHRNSKIRPISFKLGEKVESMLLCGCKLSKVAPFCDTKTCITLKLKEEEEINKKIEADKKI